MLFSELKKLDNSTDQNQIPYSLIKHEPDVPDIIIKNFLIDASYEGFQNELSFIAIDKLKWNLIEVTTSNLVNTSMLQCLEDHFESRCSDWASMDQEYFYEYSEDIHEHEYTWKINGSWSSPPIFIDGSMLNQKKYFLVDGATRLGALKGLFHNPNLNLDLKDKHQIYFGSY